MHMINIVQELCTVINFLRRLLRSFFSLTGFLLSLFSFLLCLLSLDFLYALSGPLRFPVWIECLLLDLLFRFFLFLFVVLAE